MISSENSSSSLLHLLHRAGQCADELFLLNIGQNALTPRQFEVLKAVHSSANPSQTLLVELTGIDRSTLADIVRRLVDRGLLVRNRTRRDARMYEVGLTAEGERTLRATEPIAHQTNERLLSGLSTSEREALAKALGHIISSARATQG